MEINEIIVGMSESYSQTITDADIKAFAGISGETVFYCKGIRIYLPDSRRRNVCRQEDKIHYPIYGDDCLSESSGAELFRQRAKKAGNLWGLVSLSDIFMDRDCFLLNSEKCKIFPVVLLGFL